MEWTLMQDVNGAVFARGFLLTNQSEDEIARRMAAHPFSENVHGWTRRTFAGHRLWTDRRLMFGEDRSKRRHVAVLGLCINPFTGEGANDQIAKTLLNLLGRKRSAFFDYVDQLSGTFVLLIDDARDVFVIGDA